MWLAVLLTLMPAASLLAHHLLAGHDRTPVRAKGTVVRGEARTWQVASEDPSAVSLSGNLITAEMIVLDGQVQGWGDYGFHHRFPPGYRDQHSR